MSTAEDRSIMEGVDMDHILVVDDGEEVRVTLKSALEKCFEVFLAAGALQAVAICREQPIRLVISDLRPKRT